MADENGIVVKPAIVKQDGNTTEIEIHIEKPAEPEREQTEAAEAAQDKPRKSLTEEFLRESPALKSYNTTIQRYSLLYKQLTDLLPPPEVDSKKKNEVLDFITKQG